MKLLLLYSISIILLVLSSCCENIKLNSPYFIYATYKASYDITDSVFKPRVIEYYKIDRNGTGEMMTYDLSINKEMVYKLKTSPIITKSLNNYMILKTIPPQNPNAIYCGTSHYITFENEKGQKEIITWNQGRILSNVIQKLTKTKTPSPLSLSNINDLKYELENYCKQQQLPTLIKTIKVLPPIVEPTF
jgi:hypothetical protein